MVHVVRYVLGGALAGYGALQILGRQAGSTAPERRMRLAGDELVARPRMRTDHAVTIEAPPDQVWPWLTQMGWHLGGYYTPEWVDRLLFPKNWSSLAHLDPALLRDLRVGDIIPDGAPGTAWYVVVEVDPPHVLVLRSTNTFPRGGARSTAPGSTGRGASGSPSCLASEPGYSRGSVAGPSPGG